MPWSLIARERPAWMTVRAPSQRSRFAELDGIVRDGGLHTVCQEARCPNIGECWGRGTATFQIMGDVCTRACRYCAVMSGKRGEPLDPLEPGRVATAAARMGLSHVVVTSVDRDDLPDAGAGHWARTIRALRRRLPDASIEALVPDFRGSVEAALRLVIDAAPDVFNHNIETCRRLQPAIRRKGDYDQALAFLAAAKQAWRQRWPHRAPLVTKSGLIVGMGETDAEVGEVMRDLRAHGVDIVTIGQYLQPSARHLPLQRWVTPDAFAAYSAEGERLGFASVFAGPLVRSSYHAGEQRRTVLSRQPVVAS